jgi:hypothetical protein
MCQKNRRKETYEGNIWSVFRSEVLTIVIKKVTNFWLMTLFSLTVIYTHTRYNAASIFRVEVQVHLWLPWRYKQQNPENFLPSLNLHDAITHKTLLFSNTVFRTSNLAFLTSLTFIGPQERGGNMFHL